MTLDFATQLETAIQKAVDGVRNDPQSLELARTASGSPAFIATAPSLSVWFSRVCLDGGHANEELIRLAGWSDLDVAAGLGACLALVRQPWTPALSTLAVALVEAFGGEASRRLTLRAIQRLTGEAA